MSLVLENITFGYESDAISQPITGTFKKGVMTAIVGMNGTGKSTLLKGLAGLIPPMSGRLERFGSLSYLPQNPQLNDEMPLSLFEMLAMPFLLKKWMFAKLSGEEKKEVTRAARMMGLEPLLEKPFNQLSGGQQQRALLARLLLNKSDIYLLDEPFSALDDQSAETGLFHLKTLAQAQKTVICVLHDYDLVRRFFKQTLILSPRLTVLGETREVLTPDNLHKAHHA